LNLRFTKMHGLGNDFIVVAADNEDALPDAAGWRALADRHTGVGFDQALVVLPPRRADAAAFYRIYNADGSEVEQCGNGARCVAEWLRLAGRAAAPDAGAGTGAAAGGTLRMDSLGGRVEARFVAPGLVSVNMGVPRFAEPGESTLELDGRRLLFTEVSMGNPHIVLRVADAATAPVDDLGRTLESHPRFPQRTNVGFLQIIDEGHARLRVYERGVGETLACGTGACAAMAVGHRLGLLADAVEIRLPGGSLQLQWRGEGADIWMTGPAVVAFRGETGSGSVTPC
jgi:diaminopimelate epimerase